MSRYKVRNWSQYNESLKKRGSLSLWISEDAIEKWRSSKDPHFIGAPQQYSDDAILCMMALKVVNYLNQVLFIELGKFSDGRSEVFPPLKFFEDAGVDFNMIITNGEDPEYDGYGVHPSDLPPIPSSSIANILTSKEKWDELEEFLGLPGVDLNKQQLPFNPVGMSPEEIVQTLRNRTYVT